MKKLNILLLFVLMVAPGISVFSQEDEIPNNDKVESLRVSIYSLVLKLTPEEAKVFWPVFNK